MSKSVLRSRELIADALEPFMPYVRPGDESTLTDDEIRTEAMAAADSVLNALADAGYVVTENWK